MDRISKLRRAHESLTESINKLRAGRWGIEDALKAEAAKVLDRETVDYEPGNWECEDKRNPLGECVYDGDEDPCWDECLFCGEPWERK